MRARALARSIPVLPLDAPAAEVARLLAAESVGVVFLTDPAGAIDGAVTDGRLLWCEGGRPLGGITTSALLTRLLGDA